MGIHVPGYNYTSLLQLRLGEEIMVITKITYMYSNRTEYIKLRFKFDFYVKCVYNQFFYICEDIDSETFQSFKKGV